MLGTVWIATSPLSYTSQIFFYIFCCTHCTNISCCLLFTPIWWRRMCHAQTSPEMFHPPTSHPSLIPPQFPTHPSWIKRRDCCDLWPPPPLKYLIQIKPLWMFCALIKRKRELKKKHKFHLTWLSVVLSPYHPPPQVSCIRSIPQIRPSDRLSFGRLSQVKTKMTKLPQQKNKNTLDHQKHNNNIKTNMTL
jgi:hypothetical protein